VILLRWHADPVVVTGLALLGLGWVWALRRAPAVPVPRRRWFVAAYVVLVVALMSPLAWLSEERFSAHMVQHLLLTYLAAPFLALAAPVTVALQALGAGAGRRRLLAVLHSRALRVLTHPVLAWVLFAAVMYATHFSGIYDAALGNPFVHGLEHLLYLAAAALFWWPVVRRDPVPGSFPWPGRLLYLFLAMPLQSFLGVAILNSERVLYAHYAVRVDALADQQLAGAIMWGGGDALMLVAMGCVVAGWFKHDQRETERLDARLDAMRASR
jgi:putative copper resistance protein D